MAITSNQHNIHRYNKSLKMKEYLDKRLKNIYCKILDITTEQQMASQISH